MRTAIKLAGLLTLYVCVGMVWGQSVVVYPGNVSGHNAKIPLHGYQVFSAVVTGLNDKTVHWTATGGTLIGTNPCTDATTAPCTIAVKATASSGDFTITATTNTGGVTATGGYTFVATPTPSTSHPRLMINSSNLAALRTYFASGAAIPTAFIAAANTITTNIDNAWSTGSGGGGYTCDGGNGIPNASYRNLEQTADAEFPEIDAWIQAEMSLVDPTTGNRAREACRAHDLFMYVNGSILGTIPGSSTCTTCFHVPAWLLGNRGSSWAEAGGLTLDWVYSTFSSGDLSGTIVPAMITWQQEINTNSVIANGYVQPIGAQNDPALIQASGGGSFTYNRNTMNNYSLYMVAAQAAMGLAIDAADDPNTAHCSGGFDKVCTDGTPNSVRAGFHNSLGGYLYLQNLNMEDPAITTAEYNAAFGSSLSPSDTCLSNVFGNPSPTTPNVPCYGHSRGGISHEGALYMQWLYHFANMADLIKSSGNDDPTNYPQLSILNSSWWDLTLQGYLHLTAPAIFVNGSQNIQLLYAYGPVNVMFDQINLLANTPFSLYDLDALNDRQDRNNTLGWLAGNLSIANSLAVNILGNIPTAIPLSLMQLPGATPFSGFTDPRPTMPPAYFSQNSGNLMASSGAWSATTGSVFHTYCPEFPQVNHEEGYCGTFDFYRNGDWSTKDIYSYAFNDNSGYWTGETPDTGNMPGYGNSPSQLPNPTNMTVNFVDTLMNRGGQSFNAYEPGTNVRTQFNDMPAYTYQLMDSTGGRNLYGPASGLGAVTMNTVAGATREFLWIKDKYLAVYDRGNIDANSFMRVWFEATASPTVTGTTVSWPSSLNKTSNYLHVLLQPAGNISTYPVYPFAQAIAAGNYMTHTEVLVDAGLIQHVASENHTTAPGVAITPTNRVNFIKDLGVSGGVSCGSLTQVSDLSTPGSCQYNVTSDYRYFVSSADGAAGVNLTYDYSLTGSSMRSMNLLEAQDFGVSAVGATLVQSSAGQGFDGFKSGTNLGMFMRDLTTFTGVTYPASGATTHYVSDLAPNTTYGITGAGTPGTATTDTAGVLTFSAGGSGNITIGTPSAPGGTAVSGHVVVGGNVVIQ